MNYLFSLTVFFCCFCSFGSYAQSGIITRPDIQAALDNGKPQESYRLLDLRIDQLTQGRNVDSLVECIYLAGEVSGKLYGFDRSVDKIQALITTVKKLSPQSPAVTQVYLNAGGFYGDFGKNQLAYEANIAALRNEEASSKPDTRKISLIQRNLGEYARRMANPALSEQHLRKAVALVLASGKRDHEQLYLTYNAIASMKWYASETDSAKFYFLAAVDEVKKIDSTPLNRYYRIAILNNNIAGIYRLEGKTMEAIQAMETVIRNLDKFIKAQGYEDKKKAAITFQFEAMDNLAAIYKDLGDYAKARNVLEHSYHQKKKHLAADDPAIFTSQILLGNLYYATSDFDKALAFLNQGQSAIHKEGGEYLFLDGDACYTIALILDHKRKFDQAAVFYQRADSLYAEAFQGDYDNIYLDFLRNYALFDAENGRCAQAVKRSRQVLEYVTKAGSDISMLQFYQLLNLSDIYAKCGDYKSALQYAEKAISNIQQYTRQSANLFDSVKTEEQVPRAIFLRAKAHYQLLEKKDAASITAILNDLNKAIRIIEKRKQILSDSKDINRLIEDNRYLTNFIKQLNYELFKLSGDKRYIDELISVHEASLYTRIRSRMDKQNAIRFSNLPDSIVAQEARLKERMQTALQQPGTAEDNVLAYIQAVHNWNAFQQKLKLHYPRYYDMRYATANISLEEVSRMIPEGVTVVRYIYSGEELSALVVSKQKQALIPLSADKVTANIAALNESLHDPRQATLLSFNLYKQLWQPLEKEIVTRRVTIVPDHVLYNLSFEMLTPVATSSFSELTRKCLLNRYAISYQYSLLALRPEKKDRSMKGNFIAFAPGFSQSDKRQYHLFAKNDSLSLDRVYLSLLPLPFTTSLVNKVKGQLGGDVFMRGASTPDVFKKQAGNHHIIHIGTHAESNDEYPEYSRLIFSKDHNDLNAENSVYLYEIYNCNLTSDLAILTACESGKSGYQDGEGMISMAHAFNYAGSGSIMTGLWKIDEQSSMQITEIFYENLQKGMTKDEALQQAKLTYLHKADGRMLAPQYWAGLVIMGDVAPVELEPRPLKPGYWLGAGAVALAGAWYFFRKRAAVERRR